jgi:hypothetical protein
MSVKLNDLPDALKNRSTFGFFEDFINDIDANIVVITATDSGTGAVGDAARGILPLVASDGTVADNDETYAELPPNEIFLFANDKPLIFEARVQFTEANTDDANVAVGIKDAVAANTILDNGGGPAASYTGALFFKVDGGTVWQCETSIAGTQTTTELSATNANNIAKAAQTAGGSAYQVLRIVFEPYSSTNAYVSFFINGNLVAQHDFIYTSATEMQAFAGVKNGDTNLETLNVDYIACYQAR